MKTVSIILVSILYLLMSEGFAQQTLYGTPPSSKISKALNQSQITHTLNIWEIDEQKAEDKIELIVEAVQYKAANSTDILKGVKISLFSENTSGEEKTAKTSNEFEGYIDESEYSEVLVVVSQILADIKRKTDKNSKGSMVFITKGGIKLGYIFNTKKEIAFLSLLYQNAEIRSEYSNAKKFFEEFKGYIEIASKDLYLPENKDKLKNAKKSNQEAKDVIIDDI
ncbi:MAG: hypothetical protein JEZ09_00275 [Salinivirgaceae bacterium]|nr:hypothetical protein [Salinivirgaceae bacterium]